MEIGKIIKPHKFDQFTVIPFQIFREDGISTGATGLYCWLFSHKSDQKISVEFMTKHFKDGKDSIRTKIKELIKLGYLERQEQRADNGRIVYDYVLREAPKSSTSGLPHTGLPDTVLPHTENPPQSNISILSNTINKSNISSEKNKNAKKQVFDNDVDLSYDHIVKLFPERFHPKRTDTKNKWKYEIQMIKKQYKISPRKLYLLIQIVRNDDFWSENFLSVLKLRKSNKEGIKYIDLFMNRFGGELETIKI